MEGEKEGFLFFTISVDGGLSLSSFRDVVMGKSTKNFQVDEI